MQGGVLMSKFYFISVFLLTGVVFSDAQQRYLDQVFTQWTVTSDLIYGNTVNPETNQPVELKLDLWEPSGDNELQRAVLIWGHGNQGQKNDAKTMEVCQAYVRYGYVVLPIETRWGSDQDYTNKPERLPYAAEDFKAAVRWARANAGIHRLHPDWIANGGSSAGSAASFAGTYMENEGTSGNPGFPSQPNAEVFCSGGGDTVEMETGEPPIWIAHGTDDPLVPVLFSQMIEQRAKNIGIPVEAHYVPGIGHGGRDWMVAHMQYPAQFLYQQMIAKPVQIRNERRSTTVRSLYISPNPFNSFTTIYLNNFEGDQINLTIYDITGKMIEEFIGFKNKIIPWNVPGQSAGTYLLKAQNEKEIQTRKLLSIK